MKRIIAHLDMDAFFAAIEERDRPELKGKPIVIGADPQDGRGRGVVSTASYAARKYGIRSAMPISTAWRLGQAAVKSGAPPPVYIAPHMEKYTRVSGEIVAITRDFLGRKLGRITIEEASIDEMYADLSAAKDYGNAAEIIGELKEAIKEKQSLTVSAGIGPNKLMAKIASDAQKPDGLTVVPEAEAEKFLEPLPVRTIPGVGPKTDLFLKKLEVNTVADAKKFSASELREFFGKCGDELYHKLRARDDSPLVEHWTPLSIGEQETFPTDSRDPQFLRERLAGLVHGVQERFLRSEFKGWRSVVITVRFADFTTKTRRHTLKAAAAKKEDLMFEALRLFMPFLDSRENPKKKLFRLLGVRIEGLVQ